MADRGRRRGRNKDAYHRWLCVRRRLRVLRGGMGCRRCFGGYLGNVVVLKTLCKEKLAFAMIVMQFLRHANKGLPLRPWLLSLATVSALSLGFLNLGSGGDVEVATAAGFVYFFTFTVGSWLGVKCYAMLMRIYNAWATRIETRTDAILARLLDELGRPERSDLEENATRAGLSRVLRFLMKQSFLPVLFCTAVLVNIVFQAVLFSRIDYPGHEFRTYFAMGSFIALAFLVACQSLYLLKLQNQIGSLERRAEKMFAGVQSRSDFWIPDIKGPEVIRYSIIRLDQLSRRFIGLGL